MGISLVVQWLRLSDSSAGDLGSIPGQGTRSRMLQLRPSTAKLKHKTRNNKECIGSDFWKLKAQLKVAAGSCFSETWREESLFAACGFWWWPSVFGVSRLAAPSLRFLPLRSHGILPVHLCLHTAFSSHKDTSDIGLRLTLMTSSESDNISKDLVFK